MIKIVPSEIRRKVSQLFVIRASGHMFNSQRDYPLWELSNRQIKYFLEEGVGGVIFFGGTITELHFRCKTLRQWARNPLLLCADVEEGVGQRFQGASHFLPPMAIAQIYLNDPKRALELAELYGRYTAEESILCGLNWILAPVCDINTNFNNPVINMRAWGEDPEIVSTLVCAFNRGLRSQNVFSCAKHFPGHGDTEVDSHLELPVLRHDINRLLDIELLPFRRLIDEGVSSIMIGHLLINEIDSKYPATLSIEVTTGLLRERLGYKGLIVTDALVMDSIAKRYGSEEAVILAFEAGADLILMPKDIEKSIGALCDAIISGRITMDRLQESLDRRASLLKTNDLHLDHSSQKEIVYKSQEINNYSLKSFQDELIEKSISFNDLYVRNVIKGINLLRIDDFSLMSRQIDSTPMIALPKKAGYKPILLHQLGLDLWQESPINPLNLEYLGDEPIFLQIFYRGKPFVNNITIREPWIASVKQLQRDNRLSGIIVYGSYYLWQDIEKILDPNVPALYSPGQMQSAQMKALSCLFNFENNENELNHELLDEFTD